VGTSTGGCAGFNERLHQLECVQIAPKAGFCIGHDRQHPVNRFAPFGMGNLVGSQQRVIDGPDQGGNTVGGIETLVRIHLPAKIGVGGNLPAAQVDGFQSRSRHFDRLIAGERAESGDVAILLEQAPKLLSARAGQ
jgi:hypothetical protein